MLFWRRTVFCAIAFVAAASAAAAETRRIVVSSADPADFGAVFEPLRDGDVVVLRLSGRDGAAPDLREADGDVRVCRLTFGPLSLAPGAVAIVPTGDANLLVAVELGDPERHAGNLAICEYIAPERTAVTLRGCFLAVSWSVPTARALTLRPLAAEACLDGSPRPSK